MSFLPLSNSRLKIQIDDRDYETLSRYRWHLTSRGYAASQIKGRKTEIQRLIFHPPNGMVIDHINRCPLDCRRANMRICTPRENVLNSGPRVHNKLGVKGVTRTSSGKYRATIRVRYKQIYLGRYPNLRDAAKAYNMASRRFFGQYAYQNVLKEA
jgi:hypothetical protein